MCFYSSCNCWLAKLGGIRKYIIGGRFLYQEGVVKGVKKPDSGYRHDVKYKVIKDGKHPITEGIEDFEITDELYLAEFLKMILIQF